MYRGLVQRAKAPQKSPHRRGDVPSVLPGFYVVDLISPQAWGCTGRGAYPTSQLRNLPTGVGMYRLNYRPIPRLRQSPHRRGDVPTRIRDCATPMVISPQAWGCTGLRGGCRGQRSNLPTGVGMYRNPLPGIADNLESPHRRGDVPFTLPSIVNRL